MVEFQPEIIRENLNININKNNEDPPTLDIQQPAIEEGPTGPIINSIPIKSDVRHSKEAERDFLVPEIYNRVATKLVVEEVKINGVGINIYKMPFFTEKFCETLIKDAEECDAWTSDRHDNYPTTDIPLISMVGPNGRNWDELYEEYLLDYAYQKARDVWNLENANFLSETFIAKYEVHNQSSLDIHHDSSWITFVAALNDDYRGGGTYFEKWDINIQLPQGWIAFHPGYCGHKHGGKPVREGTRYICISFAGKV